ncbi:MAG: YdeI/OmpD-associated family protein [Actinomycetota bacterium]
MVEVPDDLARALQSDDEAWAAFTALSEQDQQHLVDLVMKARNAEHRKQRVEWILRSMSGPFFLLVGAAISNSLF